MSFADDYERFSNDPKRDTLPHPLFMAQAKLCYPDASEGELEILALQFIPEDFALIVACEEIKAEGGVL